MPITDLQTPSLSAGMKKTQQQPRAKWSDDSVGEVAEINTNTTRRRIVNSPHQEDDKEHLLTTGNASIDDNDDKSAAAESNDAAKEDDRLTLMEQVVLMGIKDDQVQYYILSPFILFMMYTTTHTKQGYLSFMNDTISYVLRGCILLELILRGKVKFVEGGRRGKQAPLTERHIELTDPSYTGEVLIDETIKLMKQERHSIGGWIDLLSGTFIFDFLPHTNHTHKYTQIHKHT